MQFADSISHTLKKYFDFNGRASRSEFWFFLLFVAVAQAISRVFGAPIAMVIALLLFVPQLSVAVRRLHDISKSGREMVAPVILLAAAPLVMMMPGALMSLIKIAYGGIVLLVFVRLVMLWAKKGSSIPNKYGAAPTAFSFAKA